jgi:hypothetical protein
VPENLWHGGWQLHQLASDNGLLGRRHGHGCDKSHAWLNLALLQSDYALCGGNWVSHADRVDDSASDFCESMQLLFALLNRNVGLPSSK